MMKQYMIQRIKECLMSVAILSILSACDNDSVMYNEGNRVYFPEDYIYYSFGDKALNYKKHTIEVPVKVLGDTSGVAKRFKVDVDVEGSTAIVGKHYTMLDSEYEVKAGSVDAVIPIELLRDELGTNGKYLIVLKLVATNDFELGVGEALVARCEFSNELDEPKWWYECERYVGPYHPAKYQKFIEINGEALPDKITAFTSRRLYWLAIFKDVKEYFDKNPQEGVIFPDVIWPL